MTRIVVTTVLAGALGGGQLHAQRIPELDAPPGARVVPLPRKLGDVSGETSVAIDPADPRRVLVAYQQFLPVEGEEAARGVRRLNVRVARSEDGGESWTIAAGTAPPDYLVSGDPSVVIDRHGHAFLAYIAFDRVGQAFYWGRRASRNGIYVRRSMDGGQTWEATDTPLIEYPTMENPPFQDKGYLVIDNHPRSPHSGNLYIGWTRYTLEKSEILFSRSADDGKTWSKPIVISTERGSPRGSQPGAVVGFQGVVGRDGTVYAMWPDGQGLVVAVSRDGGRTFGRSRRAVATTPPLFPSVADFPGANGLPTIGIDPRTAPGRLFLSWGDHRYGDLDVLASTSSDGGRTWSAPVRVNDDPKHDGKDQVLSWLTVDPADGSAYALFYDRRADTGNVVPRVTLARSTDGGRSFTNYAWTTTGSDPRKANYGDYLGMAALQGRVYGAWVEDAPPDTSSSRDAPESSIGQRLGAGKIMVGIARFEAIPASRARPRR